MRRNRVLVLVCKQNHVNKILADINDSTVVVALEYRAQEELDKHQISYHIPENYTSNETYKDLDKKALSFARTWHSFNAHVEELATYKNINLGKLVEWEFTYFIAGVMKYIEMINCILEKEQPDKIIVVDDNPEVNSIVEAEDENLAIKTAIILGKQKNIPVSIINAPCPIRQPSKSLKSKVFHLIIPMLVKTLNFVHRLKVTFRKKTTKRNRILMAIGWGYIGSVVKELKKNSTNEIIMFGKDYSISWGSIKKKVIHKCLKDYKIKIGENSLEVKQRWNELNNNQKFKESMVYQGIQIWSLVKERLEYLFLNRFPELIKNMEIFKCMLDKENIDMIVVAYDVVEFEKTLVTVGNQKGVPSLIIQHGLPVGSHAFVPVSASHIAVGGPADKDWLINYGVDTYEPVVTGIPRYDILLEKNNRISNNFKKKLCDQLNLDFNKKLIVFAAEGGLSKVSFPNFHFSLKQHNDMIYQIIKAIDHIQNAQLIIKLHPGYSKNKLYDMLNLRFKENVKVIENVDMISLLSCCDVLIHAVSTVGLEAIILNKPVISVDMRKDLVYRNPFRNCNATIFVSKQELLVPAIKDALYDKQVQKELENNSKKFVYEHAYEQDGKATERVVNLIEKMIQESKRNR